VSDDRKRIFFHFFEEIKAMEIPGSSSCLTTLQESVLLDEDPDYSNSRSQQWISLMNLPLYTLA
jgi:hypothetical protein